MTAFDEADRRRDVLDRRQFLNRSGRTVLGASLAPSALAALAASCGGDEAGSPGGGGDGVLRIAVSKDTESLDGHNIAFIRSDEMVANLYESPMWWPLKEDGFQYPEPEPWFVTSVESNPEKTLFTFVIPSDRKFASGSPITMDDLEWSFRRMGAGGLGQFYFGVTAVDAEKPITVVDETTFTMETGGPSNFLLQVLATESFAIFEKAEMEKHATGDDPWALEWAKTNTAGSGAYVIERYTPGTATELRRNPNFIFHDVIPERVSLPIVPSVSDRISLLQRGDVHVAQDLPLERIADLQADPNLEVVNAPATTQTFLVMNTSSGPFQSKELRQAVNYALPYDQIIENVYFRFAQRLPGPVPIGGRYQDPNLKPYTTDLERATALAEASGQTPVSIDLHYDAGTRPEETPLASVVRSALAPIGINVTLRPTQPAPFAEKKFAKEFDFFIDWILFWVDDPAYGLRWYHSEDFFNYAQYKNPVVDKLLTNISVEIDEGRRTSLAYELQRIVVEDAPFAWMVQPNLTYANRKGVTGLYPHPTGMMYYSFMSPPA